MMFVLTSLLAFCSRQQRFVKQGELEARMLSGLLSGVNRVYRFANIEDAELDKHLDTMFKVAIVPLYIFS
jgi:hypothetical protein